MIFLNIQDRRYSIFRIKHLLRNLDKKKKGMKRLSEQKTKVINKIAFYEGILQKLQQYEGDVHYGNENNEPIFTEPEIFYISMILGMRGCYERMKQLSELRFTKHEKLHNQLQIWVRRVLQLDPKLFDDYTNLNQLNNRINMISSTIETMRVPFLYFSRNEYNTWFQNLLNSFALLDDYQRWRPLNFAKQSGVHCCQGRGRCDCHVTDIENRMYRIISANVFFDIRKYTPGLKNYW